MSNLTKFEQASVPAHLAALFPVANDLSANVGGGFPVLSLKGKVWTVVRGKDDRTVIKNDDGDTRSSIEVVIVKANPQISKVFYSKGYVEGSDAKPECYSNDGTAPAADAENPQAKKCAVCPHNQWGSKISESGAKIKACTDSRRIAVAPAGDLKDPMLLRVPAASLKPLSDYGDMFARKGVPYQAAVTKISFDPDTASPKLLFKFERFLDADGATTVREVMDSPVVADILGTGAIGATAVVPEEDFENAPKAEVAPKPVAAKPVAKPKPAPKQAVEEVEVVEAEEVETPKPVTKKAAKPAPEVVDGDDMADELDAILGSLDD